LLRSAYEKKHLSVSSYETVSDALPQAFDGFRIAFLSDLHGEEFGNGNEELAQKILAFSPDLILFGGDMVTLQKSGRDEARTAKDLKTLDALLTQLKDTAPVLYADGNHERRFFDEKPLYPGQKEAFLDLLEKHGVHLLRDARETVERDGERFYVSGLSLTDTYYEKFRKTPFPAGFAEEKLGPKPEGYEVLLLHSPLYLKEAAAYGADLVLAGHFHGGTVRLPLLGGLMTPQFQLFNPYCKGIFTEGKTTQIVSAGLGTHSVPIRFNNRPDLVLITLHRRKE
ncbi:MAG: metallophosphoesterase, partial [Lachnospiraceae bacterium]|nr:metallophosphoesterase [Lachnospiraceae bacterium]